jgi:hypothetical protein
MTKHAHFLMAFTLIIAFHEIKVESAQIIGWGRNDFGQITPPAGLSNVIAIAAGGARSLALKKDGTIVMWGDWTNIPLGLTNVIAIASGDRQNLALRSDGTVVDWVNDYLDHAIVKQVPAGLSNVVKVACGNFHNLALLSDGTVTAWGSLRDSPKGLAFYLGTVVPKGLSNVVDVAAGYNDSLALKADGTVVAWGDDEAGETDVPEGLSNVVAIACGWFHDLAVRSDGTVVAWGATLPQNNNNPLHLTLNYGQTNVPAGLNNVVAVAGGHVHSVALMADGKVVSWGDVWTNVPPDVNNVIAIACGDHHSLALVGKYPLKKRSLHLKP